MFALAFPPATYVHVKHIDVEKNCEIKYILNKTDSLFNLFISWLLVKNEETTKASYIVTTEQIILQDKLS